MTREYKPCIAGCDNMTRSGAWQCDTCKSLRRGSKRLTSVSRILSVWPVDPCNQCGMPIYSDHVAGCRVKAAIVNATERGREVDDLFSRWINGTLLGVPRDTRIDARDRLGALVKWWQSTHPMNSEAKAQVLVADATVGGVLDLYDASNGFIYDVKNTSSISESHPLQLGGYALLWEATYGTLPRGVGVVHVTQRKDSPVTVKFVEFDIRECVADFKTCRSMYEMFKRRSPKKRDAVVEEFE